MKQTTNQNSCTSIEDNNIFDGIFESLKVGHSILVDTMKKSPISSAIFFFNDAIFNISISTTAQHKSFAKSSIKFTFGSAAATFCTVETGGLTGSVAPAFCGYIGSEISGMLYDAIAKASGYDDTEKYIQEHYDPGITFEDVLSRYKILDKLKNGDHAYVNLPSNGTQLYTKLDDKLQKIAIPPPDPSFLKNLHIEKSSVQLKTSGEDGVNIRVDSFLTENSLIPDYNVQISAPDSNEIARYAYSNLSLNDFAKKYNISLDMISEENHLKAISLHLNVYTLDPSIVLGAIRKKEKTGTAEEAEKSTQLVQNVQSVETKDDDLFSQERIAEFLEQEVELDEQQWELDSKLRSMVERWRWQDKEDFSEIIDLLKEGASINGGAKFVKIDGEVLSTAWKSPIVSATRRNNIKLVDFLIASGANINQKNGGNGYSDGETATMVAIHAGNEEMYEFLIKSGSSLDVQDSKGRTIMHRVINNEDLVKYLLLKGAKVDIQDFNGNFPINLIKYSNQSLLKVLIEKAIEQTVNLQKYYLFQPKEEYGSLKDNLLHSCIQAREFQLVKLMIDSGLPTDSLYRDTPILEHFIRSLEYPEEKAEEIRSAINSLVVRGVDMSDGKALFDAISRNLYEIANLLIEAGSNLNYDEDGKNLLHLMITQGRDMGFLVSKAPNVFLTEKIFLINKLLKKGINIDAIYCGKTVLEHLLGEVCQYTHKPYFGDGIFYIQGFKEITILLIQSGVNLDYVNSSGKTYLNIAVDEKLPDVVKALIEQGILSKIDELNVFQALKDSVTNNKADIISMLLDAGVKVIDKQEENLLMTASIVARDPRIIELLCIAANKQGVNELIVAQNKCGDTPLLNCVNRQNIELVEILLKYGANIKDGFHNKEEMSPFHLAAWRGYTKVIDFYLKHEIDQNVLYGRQKGSVLYYAITNHEQEIAIKLLESGADATLLCGVFKTDMWEHVLKEDCAKVAKYMLKHGSTITENNLHYITGESSIEMLEVLLQNSQLVNCRDIYLGRTLLHMAVFKNDIEKLKLLIQYEANVHLERDSGFTALEECVDHYLQCNECMKSRITEMMDVLVANGAIIRPIINNKSLLGIASSHGNEKSVQYLIDKGLKIDILDEYLCSPLHYASSLDTVEVLVTTSQEIGLNVQEYINATNKDGYSALWINATNKNHPYVYPLKIVRYLLDNGANPNITHNDESLLCATIKNNLKEIIPMLVNYGALITPVELVLAQEHFGNSYTEILGITDINSEDNSTSIIGEINGLEQHSFI